ncbi:cysteine proteinase [Neurospora crassa]|nr:cysteine proteinase [Neurospora crassa]
MDPNSEPATTRRSGRARKPNTRYAELSSDDELNSSAGVKASRKRASLDSKASAKLEESADPERLSMLKESPASEEPTTAVRPRRSAKRKAAPEVFDVPMDVLEASLGPWQENELAEWPSWTDVESDPVFFNRILRLLGIREANVREVLSVDEESLLLLPEPLYGLVFLFQVMEEEEEDLEPDEEFGLWFANQTTNNACATVALFNIIMNAQDLPLDINLSKFKEESGPLSPPLRGHLLSNSSWIRVAHNHFARRLDLLNAALALENKVEDSKKKRAKTTARRKKEQEMEDAYHFVAYVPNHGDRSVWELDGLKFNPRYVGKFEKGAHWTSVAQPVIQEKMMEYEADQLAFSLLALCGDRRAALRRQLAVNIHCTELLNDAFRSESAWFEEGNDSSSFKDHISNFNDQSKLDEFQLSTDEAKLMIKNSAEARRLQDDIQTGGMEMAEALLLRTELRQKQEQIRAEYYTEVASGPEGDEDGDAQNEDPGRRKDHTPAIHEWVTKLAERGVLRELHEQVKSRNGS